MNKRKIRKFYRSSEGQVVVLSVVVTLACLVMSGVTIQKNLRIQSCLTGTIQHFISDDCGKALE